MTFRIVETFTRAKSGDDSQNEDIIVQNEHFVAVIDGATAKRPGRFATGTPGRTIALVIEDAFSSLKPDMEMSEVFTLISQVVSDDPRLDCSAAGHDNIDPPTAALIIASFSKQEVWVLGDCHLLVDDKVYDFSKKVDLVNAEFRSLINKTALLNGKTIEELRTHDVGRQAIMGSLEGQVVFQNNKDDPVYGFGVMDGSPDALHFARKIDISNAQRVILASDGYPSVKETLEESEAELARILEEDPLLIHQNQQTKGWAEGQVSYDDRSYVRLEQS